MYKCGQLVDCCVSAQFGTLPALTNSEPVIGTMHESD